MVNKCLPPESTRPSLSPSPCMTESLNTNKSKGKLNNIHSSIYKNILSTLNVCYSRIKQSTSLKRPKYWTWRCFNHIFHYIRSGILSSVKFSCDAMQCKVWHDHMCTNTTVPTGLPHNTTSTLHSSLCICFWIQQ